MKLSFVAAAAAAALLSLAARPALADVAPVGEFFGDDFESFEYIAPGSGGTFPTLPLFSDGPGQQGIATLSNPFANFLILTGVIYNFPNDVELTAYNGNLFAGVVVGQALITFDTPVMAFGGYLGTSGPGFQTTDPSILGNAVIRDAAGNILDTESLDVPIGDWAWHGWQSDTPFTSIELTIGQFPPGEALLLDDLVYSLTAVPEPTTASLLAVAGLAALRRRRA